MAYFEHKGTRIYYEVHGTGFPLLLIAPGGMKSAIPLWANAPWDPVKVLAADYRIIAMDQRNAGRSSGPIDASAGWQAYTDDQLRLMDHLGIGQFHTAGMCIGGSYCLGLARSAPDRVASAVLMQPIGLHDNREAFYQMFDLWADELKARSHAEVPEIDWTTLRGRFFDGDFVFNMTREEVQFLATPLLILQGGDLYHPASISVELAKLAPDATLVENWKTPEHVQAGQQAVEALLRCHTPD